MDLRHAIIFETAYRELRPRAPMPEFKVHFFPFANLNSTIRLRDGSILVRLSDLLEGAPTPVLHAILHILLAKLYRKGIDEGHASRYRTISSARCEAGNVSKGRQDGTTILTRYLKT